MEDNRDLIICLNERFRRVDVPFDNFGQNRPPKVGRIRPKCPKTVFFFSKYELVRA